MRSALRELQACARHKIGYNPRHKNFTRLRLRHNAGCRVNRYTADISISDFNLTGMQTGAEWQADLL